MRENKSDVIRVRVSEEFKKRIEKVAREMEVDVSTLTRSVLAEKVRQWTIDQPEAATSAGNSNR